MSLESSPLTPLPSELYRPIPDTYAYGVTLGAKIKKLREAAGITQADLAQKLGIGQAAVSKWERGENRPDSIKLPVLVRLIGGSVDELLKDDRERSSTNPGRLIQREDSHGGAAIGSQACSVERHEEQKAFVRELEGVSLQLINLVTEELQRLGLEGRAPATRTASRRGRHRKIG